MTTTAPALTTIDLIYCAGANPHLTQIASEQGYLLGVRSDRCAYDFPISFVDIDYKQPDFPAHLEIVKKHQPKYASVPDLSEIEISEQDIDRAVFQAEQLALYCEIVLVIPKLSGQIAMLPSDIAIGYSVPTSYGGAQYPIWELAGRRIHLLGGSPHEQMKIYRYVSAIGTVLSADGNMAQKIAIQYAKYWKNGQWIEHPERGKHKKDLYFECWRWSCQSIMKGWRELCPQ